MSYPYRISDDILDSAASEDPALDSSTVTHHEDNSGTQTSKNVGDNVGRTPDALVEPLVHLDAASAGYERPALLGELVEDSGDWERNDPYDVEDLLLQLGWDPRGQTTRPTATTGGPSGKPKPKPKPRPSR